MHRYASNILFPGLLISLFSTSQSFGSEIFHWVDEDGVLNFSDWAPENSNVQVAKLTVSDSNPPGYDPNEDQSSVLEQAQRTSDRWAELRERQEERRQQRLELEEHQRQLQPVDYDYPYYDDSYYFYRPVHRPPIGHRRPFKVQRRQFAALDHLGLTGPRPHSINSSAHLARINATQSLNSGFQARPPGKMQHASAYKEW